ncbi:hypothetical protein [Saccharopolyspora sp. NPDC002376]
MTSTKTMRGVRDVGLDRLVTHRFGLPEVEQDRDETAVKAVVRPQE